MFWSAQYRFSHGHGRAENHSGTLHGLPVENRLPEKCHGRDWRIERQRRDCGPGISIRSDGIFRKMVQKKGSGAAATTTERNAKNGMEGG